MITIAAILVGLAVHALWNRRRPTTGAGQLWRAGILLAVAGAATMPWQWWSGLPEVAVVGGIVCAALGWRQQRQHPARPPEQA
jgi:4-hydroxybenzoate polyprenyltransferase